MSKRIKIIVASLLLAAVVAASFGAGCVLGDRNSPETSTDAGETGLGIVEQAWDVIFQDYVDKDQLDVETLAQGAIRGMVEALDDPHTYYLDAETYQLSLENWEGKFGGIGAHVAVKDEQIVIVAPMPGSPAEGVGIRAGDVILAVDGVSTEGLSLTEVVLKVRGPEGTPVTLSVLHEGETEPEVVEVVRAEIELPSVYFEMREDIAYINITDFTERTAGELSPVLESIIQQGATGIVLDLRGNLGGLLEAVVDVAGFFLKEGVVVEVVDSEEDHYVYSVRRGGMTINLPVVVLVDGYSASGSEVLAGALQDYGRATIAGTRTFGKGSANILRQLEDGSALYITYARWFTPNGRMIEGEGIYPDYELELEGEDAIQWAIDYLRTH